MGVRVRLGLAAAAACLLLPAGAASAVSLDPIGAFSSPVFVTSDPRDPERLFVVEQGGRIRLVENGVQSTYLDLNSPTDLVASGGERGLLSMAFAPDFETSGHFYVYYTREGSGLDLGDIQIDEFAASPPGADTVAQSSRRAVVTVQHDNGVTSNGNHNGGQLQFGPDGYLYAGTGDGGGGGDPFEAGQDVSSLLGKLLRIDPDPSGGNPYSVPADNPFVGIAGADEIWSYGLRNPWRFSFDRLTGNLVIGDVGQGSWEEIDYAQAPNAGRGANFGWDCREGRHDYEADVPGDPNDCILPFTEPIFEYANPLNSPASVTGGYVVRDASLGDLYGRYLYADVYEGVIRSLVPSVPDAGEARSEGLAVTLPVSFGEDSCGRIYVSGQGGPPAANVFRLTGDTPADCGPEPPPLPSCDGVEATIVAEPGVPVTGTSGDDVVVGTEGDDEIRTGAGSDRVCSGLGSDSVTGGTGADGLKGNRGKDRLGGGAGRDSLGGGPGRDTCHGGAGRDRLRSC
jgi:glucose/arabinose dehydrogenase